jgi:hypothetical protein
MAAGARLREIGTDTGIVAGEEDTRELGANDRAATEMGVEPVLHAGIQNDTIVVYWSPQAVCRQASRAMRYFTGKSK